MTGLAPLDDELLNAATELSTLGLSQEKQQLKNSLHDFVKASWHIVEPSQPFHDNWHIRKLCKILEGVTFGRTKRLIINIPPGTMKSLLIEVFWPAWVWARNPRKRFLCVSYGQHLTTRDNLRARQIIESAWFQTRWQVKLEDDQNTKTRYNTDKNGWRIATSIDGVGTGEHPDFIILDDPTSAQGAESQAERDSANNYFDNTVSTRLGRNPAIVLVQQRQNVDDMSGHLLKRKKDGGWVHVRWPMRFEKCACPTAPECSPHEEERCAVHKADPEWTPDPSDERTEHGELLFPAMFPEEKVRGLELNLGPYGAAGQLQQRPSPEGGGLFKRGDFKFMDKAPSLKRIARGWDTAATANGGDYTTGVKISEEFEWIIEQGKPKGLRSTGRFYVEDVQRDQLGPSDVDKLIKSTAESDGKICACREEKEGGSAGKTVIEARAKMMKGFNYAGVQISGSKVTRAKPFRSQVEAGNVYLVRAAWNEEYIRELCAFPTGDHDDQVDGSSTAFNAVLLEEPPRKVGLTW